MIKLFLSLMVVFLSIELIAQSALANDQNMFVDHSSDDIITTKKETVDYIEKKEAPAVPLSLTKGKSPGFARGGDRLFQVKSTDSISFFPRKISLSEVLIKRMNERFGFCVNESAKAANLKGTVSKINVSQLGAYRDRKINDGSRRRESQKPWSLHATGRALDIGRIDFTLGEKVYRVPMTIGSYSGKNGAIEKSFYKAFTACWEKYNKSSDARCTSKTVLDCKHNQLHHDHVHIAIPFCPKKPGIASS